MAVTASPAAAQDPPKVDRPAAQHARLTWEERFAEANLAHDGHLTPEEAKAGYPTIARHFRAIDVEGRGFVTENDIRAWKALEKSKGGQSQDPDETLRPRNAFQLSFPDHRPTDTSASRTVALPIVKPQIIDAPSDPP
jgi:hypothetical protein